jgi:predicted amidohydrolase YtcJ
MHSVLFNGNVLADQSGAATAIAIDDGVIMAVGDDRSILTLATPHTERIDLQGSTVVPGFEDSHAHIWKIGHLLTSMVDLRQAASFDDIADLLRERAVTLGPETWLQARGFNEAQLREQRRPTRDDVDRWVPDRPAVLTRTCGHVFVANTAALQLAGIDRDTLAPAGGIIERGSTGEPNGLLHETAIGLIQRVLPAPTAIEYEAMILAALHHQASHGITSSSDCGVLRPLLDVYLDMDRRDALPARMVVMPLGKPDNPDANGGAHSLPPQYRSPFLQVDTVKFLADGGLSSSTAALSQPYRHSGLTGVLRLDGGELSSLFQSAHKGGWRIATHAIGDVTIEQVLTALEELGPQSSQRPHRIEHFGLPTLDHLRRAAALGVVCATQSIFLRELGRNFLLSVPDALLPQVYPFRSMLDEGVAMALSSDAPVVENDSPLVGMHAAVTRRSREGAVLMPSQAITAREALDGYTRAGAMVSGEAATRGVIAAGKVADLAILNADPTAVSPEALLEMRVEMTFVAGKLVYKNIT